VEEHPDAVGQAADQTRLDQTRLDQTDDQTRLSRRQVMGLVAGGVVVVLGGGTLVRAMGGDGDQAVEPTATTGPPDTRHVTRITLPELPVPERPPDDPYAPTPQIVLGTIEIARIGLTGQLQEGIALTAIDRGPGHWPGSAMPGELGNAVVAGHRTTHSKPFARLNELQVGDPVVFKTAGGTHTYRVRGVVIVPGEAIDIAAQSYAHTATLFACHPPGSARQRIVAKLELLGPEGQPVDDDAVLPALDAGTQAGDHTLVMKDPLGKSAG
jgi:LPXTG-site transpeptidase (sortase) family protein